jgi:hypothetical protein
MPLLLFLTSFVPLLIGNESTKNFATTILLFYSTVAFASIYRTRNIFSFASPINLIFFYTTLSLALGAWAYQKGYVLVEKDMMTFEAWRHMDVSLSFIMLSLSVMLSTEYYFQKRTCELPHSFAVKTNRSSMLSGLVLAPFFFFSLDLALLGGDGDLSIIPKTILAIFIIIATQRIEKKYMRWAIYFLLITGFATFSIEDKREAIFLIFPAAYLELSRKKIKLTPKVIIWIFIIIIFLMALILIMSVARGYGGFGTFRTLLDAIPFVIEYATSDVFIAGLFANIEVNYFFIHALNAIEIIVNDPQHISLGLTIVKPLFVFLPRSIAEWKPESIIGLYTSVYDPAIRAIGGSWPISVISEFFWNFYFFAPIFTLLFSLFLLKFQILINKSIQKNNNYILAFLLFSYMNLITLARGSGFDQYAVFVILGGFFVFLCKSISICKKLIIKNWTKHKLIHVTGLKEV